MNPIRWIQRSIRNLFGPVIVQIHGGYAVRKLNWLMFGYRDRVDCDWWHDPWLVKKYCIVQTLEAAREILADAKTENSGIVVDED